MTKKEEEILRVIIEYIKENKTMPTLRFIQNRLKYKSVNSIHQYFKSLERKGYLVRSINNHLLINNNSIYNDNIKRIKIINSKKSYVELALNKKKNYLGYQIKNNFFKDLGIIKQDILIIEKGKKVKDNDLGLFIIDNKPRVMQYNYKDGFYFLKDCETIILSKVKIIGKLIQTIRKI